MKNSQSNYDSEFCGKIPLNFTNAVQSYGVFMVLSRELKIVQISDNCKNVLKLDSADILSKNFTDYFNNKSSEDIREILNDQQEKAIPLGLIFTNKEVKLELIGIFHLSNNQIKVELEIESHIDAEVSFIKTSENLKKVLYLFQQAKDVKELLNIVVSEIKSASEFDKVMIYKFDEQWNGLVLAEAGEKDMESYLDLRFPASDIPKQARDLYQKSAYRMIPDVDASTSKLIPVLNPLTNSFTDLSDCNLRNVASVHLEYLKNMKVKSSISTRIVLNNKLWGLITCHHKTARYPGYGIRSFFELISDMMIIHLSGLENQASLILALEDRKKEANIMRDISVNKFTNHFINKSPELLDLFNMDGAVLYLNGEVTKAGNVPEHSDIIEIAEWIKRHNVVEVFATDNFPEDFEPGKRFKEFACGLLVMPLSKKKPDYLIGFKPEVQKTVSWSGNPNEAIQMDADNKTYHPRNSFEIWKETVKYISTPWKEEDLESARRLSRSFIDVLEN
jgi:light-regulated signal transduction histidine kinase (bacteriophytochrome)